MTDNMLGVEFLFHLPTLPFLANFEECTTRHYSRNLKRTYPDIEHISWKTIKGFECAAKAMKGNQFFINEEGVGKMLWQSRPSKKFFQQLGKTKEEASEEFARQCQSVRERFKLDPAAWDNPNPRSLTPDTQPEQLPPPQSPVESQEQPYFHQDLDLPPLPGVNEAPFPLNILPPEPDPPVAEIALDQPFGDAPVAMHAELAPRRKGRPKFNAGEAKAANDRRVSISSAKNQIAIAAQLLDQYNQVHGGIDLSEALNIVGIKRGHPAILNEKNHVIKKKQKVEIFTECIKTLFPSLWAMLLGIDMAFMSFEAAATLRAYAGSSFMQPPREWVSDYARILSSECEEEFDVLPRGSEPHPTLTTKDDGKGTPLTSRSAVSTSLERLLRWHIVGAIAEGHDLRPFLVDSVGGDVLQYKITFDTTQTCKQDLFMMGVIPHSFPLSAKQRTINGNVQSANNVLILCLANIGESHHVIQNAVPGLRQTLKKISTAGVSVMLEGGVELKFRVEFHVAADLKALWLALGLKNFVCPFCTQTKFNDNLDSTFEVRELTGCLGVPSNRVHLCSLHATLRIVERLVKNAASFVYQHNESKFRNKKLKQISELLEFELKRKKFKITVGAIKEDKSEEALPVDEVFINNDDALGSNIGPIIENKVHVKLSALTGSQAVKILEKGIYKAIVNITEGMSNLFFPPLLIH
jgi:hypothetical protein